MVHSSKIKAFILYTSVGLLVLLAVSVTLLRLYFSSAEEYRVQLETMAGNYLGQPVTISGIDVRLRRLSPSAILNNVTLYQKDSGSQLTRFDTVSISLDAIASLRSASPIIELSVSGANLELTRNQDGTFGVKGLALTTPTTPGNTGNKDKETEAKAKAKSGEESKALGAWFLSQSRLAVRDSHISLHDEKSGERLSFENVELELRNSGERHQLNAFVNLPKSIGRELSFSADIEGNLLQTKEWSGALYLKAERVQPIKWLEQLSWQGSSLKSGMMDLEAWGQWSAGKLQSLRSRVEVAGLLLARGEKLSAIPRLSTDARLLREQDGWRLDVDKLRIQDGGKSVPATQLTVIAQGDGFSLQADRLQLAPLGVLFSYLPQIDERSRSMLQQMSPIGVVEGLQVQRSVDKKITLQGRVKALTVSPWGKLPGIERVNGQFKFNGEDGELELDAEATTLSLPQLFRKPFNIDSLQAKFSLRREKKGWHLLSNELTVANQDLSAQLGLELQLEEGAAPWMALHGRFKADDVRAVPHYLPAKKMKKNSIHWLDNAFKSGRVPTGTVQYHGYLNHFPFNNHRGRFEVLFDAEAVRLHYHDGWPDLRQLAGEVHFDGAGMWINAHGAKMFDARLGMTKVSIDNFHTSRLRVDGTGVLSVNDGLRFLRESPLSKNGGKIYKTMQGSGDVTLALKMAIPLSPVIRKKLPLEVGGSLLFAKNRFDVVEGVRLSGLNGTLRFTQKNFSADKLTAQLFGKPLTLVVFSEEGDRPQVVIAARGSGQLTELRKELKFPLLDYLGGEAQWQARLHLPRGVKGEGVQLSISSDLLGITSTLPPPLEKSAETSRELHIELNLSGVRSGEYRTTLGDDFGIVWRQRGGEAEDKGVRRLQLRMGSRVPLVLPEHDLFDIAGKGGEIDLAAWREVLHKLRPEQEETKRPVPLQIRMEQLHLLNNSSGEGYAEPLKAEEVPAISFSVDDFSYNDLPLGKVTMKVMPQGEQILLKGIRAESELFVLNGDGSWGAGGNTFFSLNLNSPDVGMMMKRFGFASVFEGGKALMSGKVWWSGAPTELMLEELNAELAVSIKDGTMVDVDPGAGRMLGILSLPALPRRLFLDFSDVFKDGLAFESLKGDLRIEQGQAYTSNLQLESVPANILITGRTGLVEQDFDQDIYVAPNVSDSVSVASALAWGPQVAAVVVLMQQIFKSNIKAATMAQYHISGSWKQPKIQRIGKEEFVDDEPLFID